MNAQQVLAGSDEDILEIAKQLRIAYGLKQTIRYAGSRDLSVHGESVAEHIFAIIFLAQYFLPLEDPEGKMDKARLYEFYFSMISAKYRMEISLIIARLNLMR
jgi:hypothetical protein